MTDTHLILVQIRESLLNCVVPSHTDNVDIRNWYVEDMGSNPIDTTKTIWVGSTKVKRRPVKPYDVGSSPTRPSKFLSSSMVEQLTVNQ